MWRFSILLMATVLMGSSLDAAPEQGAAELSLENGAKIYNSLCITCHGSQTKAGSLPTALRFTEGAFKNGHSPEAMYRTITEGYGQMVGQAWMTPQQVCDVIHYIREDYLKKGNPSQYAKVAPGHMESLLAEKSAAHTIVQAASKGTIDHGDRSVYKRMNYGPYLMKTYEVAPGNIAYKAIAQRLDGSVGGISAGKMFMLFDHDTMRIAAAWKNTFCNWRGIMFDGSHGTHTSIGDTPVFVNPVGPGWAHPETGSFEDPRFLGKDGKPYGPLPREWAQYKGLYKYGDITVLSYTVDQSPVLEMMTRSGDDVFARVLNIGKRTRALAHRVAPTSVQVAVAGGGGVSLGQEDGFHVLDIPAGKALRIKLFMSTMDAGELGELAASAGTVIDLKPYTQPGPQIWQEVVNTDIAPDDAEAAYVADEITVPYENPWNSWMRLGGFDFYEDNDSGAICTWMGDVWTFRGLKSGKLKWKRMATGLFQPLGLKIVDGTIHLTCRDQLAVVHDRNADGEADFIECLNNDHQVTEHFHEFAMGLQVDKAGNFYYAKSSRHAKTGLVPHHGTLLRVSKDGSKTDILANGFRAANGVCINDDGSMFVTDQEGHWMPKNRINWVVPNAKQPKFYGNFMGYHQAESNSDDEMEQPLVWLTNKHDRSPAELLWVKSDRWGPLKGALLNLSYGYGRIYVIPHETVKGQMQGGASTLRIPDLPTGIMRGRFNPADGQLYTCGLFAWASSRNQRPGGFWRIRYTGAEVMQPVALNATTKGMKVTFSSDIAAEELAVDDFEVKVWGLKRSGGYGSKHVNEHALEVTGVSADADGKSIVLAIDGLEPTWGMSISGKITSATGKRFPVLIHNTIHHLN